MKAFSLCKTWLFSAILAACCCLAHAQEVATERSLYLPGETIHVTFSGGPGFVADWVGLYKEGDANDKLIVWQYLDGSQNYQAPIVAGEVDFVGGLPEPGNYDVRFFENDGYGLLASAPFTVTNSPRVFVQTSPITPGTAVTVTFTNGPGNAKDWIGVFEKNAPDSAPRTRLYVDGTAAGSTAKTSGTISFPALTQAGDYEVRFFLNDTSEVLDRAPLRVEYPSPQVSAAGGNQNVTLKWPAVTWPIAVEKYTVLLRLANGTLQSVADVAPVSGEHQYVHTGQVNGAERCYVVRATGAGGQAVSESEPICTAPFVLPSGNMVSYEVEAGSSGTQAWPGALGMDFLTVNPISVTRLGVFDDGSDGLERTIVARLYNRRTRQQLATLEFTPAAPGELVGGSRFKALPQPLRLESGFEGVIVAEGYGPEEKAGNVWFQSADWSLNDGDGTLVFVGKSRFGDPTSFPQRVDNGPANRYAAGTFQFTVLEVVAPGKPVLAVIPDDKAADLSWPAVTRPLPAAKYRIFRAYDPEGAFTQIAELTGTQYRDTGLTNAAPVSYKVQAVTEAGVVGPESDVVTRVPDVVRGGVAYVVPALTAGNQDFGGTVGNDFDVVRPVRITRLGVFDDRSDGLKRAISVRLYNRATKAEVARMGFTPEDQGTLVEGNRFKDLPTPIILQPGFQGAIVASGYGADEQVANKGIFSPEELNLTVFTGGSLEFVGSSRFGADPQAYPEIADGGPANRYAAGTFAFEPHSGPVSQTMAIARNSSGKIVITWTGPGVLESTAALGGTWQAISGAASGIEITPTAPAQFYRVRF